MPSVAAGLDGPTARHPYAHAVNALGIDIGGSAVKVALLRTPDAGGDPAVARSARYGNPPVEALIASVVAAVGQVRAAPGQMAVGLCAPGLVDVSRGCISDSLNMPALVGVPLRDRLRAELAAIGLEVGTLAFVSDAHAAAFDVWASLPDPKPGRLLALSLGTGAGGCVLDACESGPPRRLLVVGGASSGHIGQMDVGFDEPGRTRPVGTDGGIGSLEAYIGLPALLARYGPDADAALARLSVADAPLVALCRALRIAHAMYRPDHIVLLGGVGVRLGHLVHALRDRVCAGLTSLARSGWRLSVGRDDFHAARGAAALSLSGLVS